jgi:hypothetical protein
MAAGIALLVGQIQSAANGVYIKYFPPIAFIVQIFLVFIIFFTTESNFMGRASASNKRDFGFWLPNIRRPAHDSVNTPGANDEWPEFCVVNPQYSRSDKQKSK